MASTVIGTTIVIDGEVTGAEDIDVRGTLQGKVTLAASLFVERSGVVEADIRTENLEVRGKVTGDIQASDQVELKSGGRVAGDLQAPRVLIADGSVFEGNINMKR